MKEQDYKVNLFLKEFEDKDAPMPREKEQALNIATS